MTSNDPHAMLLARLTEVSGNALFVLDENCPVTALAKIASKPDCQVLTNRFDLWQAAQTRGLACQFTDFDFIELADNSLDNLFFRVSKERAVVNHVINQAFRVLRPGGYLHLCGGKQEGIKTHCANAGKRFGQQVTASKTGNVYLAAISKIIQQSDPLDDNRYHQLRIIDEIEGLPVFSKPGIFGWQKIDQGSALLAEQFAGEFAGLKNPTLLDLGCGYGYLSRMAQLAGVSAITATDNNPAAVTACRENFANWGLTGEVVADDCAGNINGQFDLVVSHPPFHQGFDISTALVERFVVTAAKHLTLAGKALFVANGFVPLERLAQPYFAKSTVLVSNRQFKVLMLEHPRRLGRSS